MVDRVMTSIDIHHLLLRTSEYVTLRVKKDFTDEDLDMGNSSWII